MSNADKYAEVAKKFTGTSSDIVEIIGSLTVLCHQQELDSRKATELILEIIDFVIDQLSQTKNITPEQRLEYRRFAELASYLLQTGMEFSKKGEEVTKSCRSKWCTIL